MPEAAAWGNSSGLPLKPGRDQIVSGPEEMALADIWIRIRRFAAGLMLAAVASLVLHGGAMAGGVMPGHTSMGQSLTARGGATGAAPHHAVHHDDMSQHHGHDQARTIPDAAHSPSGPNCCASVCALAIVPPLPWPVGAETQVIAALVPALEDGAGIVPDTRKKPPRGTNAA